MSSFSPVLPAASELAARGVTFAPQIAAAASKYRLDPKLLAAVAAQETGGPSSNGGRNVVGDGGHGHGLFQIDDRFHTFARTPAAMDPAANADYAGHMISGLLQRYGGNVRKALSAYNAGDPAAQGTVTAWGDGSRLGYADSVLRHYAQLGGSFGSLLAEAGSESASEQADVNQLASLAALQPAPAPSSQHRYNAQSVQYDALIQ